LVAIRLNLANLPTAHNEIDLACYNESAMRDAKTILDQGFLEMRWRCLSLAADLDRVQRGGGGDKLLKSDARLVSLQKALAVLLEPHANRADRVQMIFSDTSPPPR